MLHLALNPKRCHFYAGDINLSASCAPTKKNWPKPSLFLCVPFPSAAEQEKH